MSQASSLPVNDDQVLSLCCSLSYVRCLHGPRQPRSLRSLWSLGLPAVLLQFLLSNPGFPTLQSWPHAPRAESPVLGTLSLPGCLSPACTCHRLAHLYRALCLGTALPDQGSGRRVLDAGYQVPGGGAGGEESPDCMCSEGERWGWGLPLSSPKSHPQLSHSTF